MRHRLGRHVTRAILHGVQDRQQRPRPDLVLARADRAPRPVRACFRAGPVRSRRSCQVPVCIEDVQPPAPRAPHQQDARGIRKLDREGHGAEIAATSGAPPHLAL